MELTKKMIEKYLNSSKKQKSQMITQYCELIHIKRAKAVKRFERYKKKYLFHESESKKGLSKKRGQRRNMNLYMKI